jgi:cytochrome c553
MRSNQTISVIGILALSLGLPEIARAGGDAAGKALSTACRACHVSTTGTDDTPHLAGQRAAYVAKQLKAFKAGDRNNPVMNAITSALDDAEINDLAAFWSSQPAGSDAIVPPEIAAIKKSKMAFPRDFPRGFALYGVKNREDQMSVAKQYVNTVAFDAVKAGKPLPDGSVIVVVHHTVKLDADRKPIKGKDGIWLVEGIKHYEGMESRSGWGKDIPELLRNVNWNYALFNADKTPRTEVNQAICLSCHVPAAKTSYVFSLAGIQAKAGVK